MQSMAHSCLYVRVYNSFRGTRISMYKKRGAVHPPSPQINLLSHNGYISFLPPSNSLLCDKEILPILVNGGGGGGVEGAIQVYIK